MQQNNLKEKVLSGMVWRFAERIMVQLSSFIISLVLARMLAPELYGTVSLVLVFINLANVLINNGLGEACVQQKDAGDKEFSTVFYCSIFFAVVLYIILFIAATPISLFYNDVSLCIVIRVLALQVPLSSVRTIQQAYVSKHMLFKKFFFSTLGGTLFSGIVGIIMALCGYGVWALVMQQLLSSFIDMSVLFFTVPWKPKKIFDFKVARKLVGYGWKLTATSFLSEFYTELRSLIIGRIYSTADLAYYNKGNQFSSLAISNLNASISSVLFPAMSTVNDDITKIKQITRKSMQISSYVIFPIMFGMMGVAEPLIRILLTDTWLPCVPYLRLCCIYWMVQPIQTANIQAIKAVGRSDICLKLEIEKKIIGIIMVLVSVRFGVYAVVASNTIYAFVSMFINIKPNKKLISYGYIDQTKDILPALVMSCVMFIPVIYINTLLINDYLKLIIQVFVGVVVYIAISLVSKNEAFNYILEIVIKKLKQLKQ